MTERAQRLDRRTITASTIIAAGALVLAAIPTAIGMVLGGLGAGWVALWCVAGLVIGTASTAAMEAIRLAVTTFRLDDHRVERRVRFLASTTTSIATSRVRSVEISANVVQRRMGIATVKLSSGETDGSRLTLASLDRQAAEDLRRRLLADRASSDSTEVARVDPGWIRYAPASFMTPLFGLIAVGVVFQVSDWFQAVPEILSWVWGRIEDVPIPLLVVAAILAVLLVGSLISAVLFVENWWAMRLDHHRDGSLEMHRGLLVGRHTTLDGSRIRGMTLHEPPGFRMVAAARLDVVAIGVGIGNDENGQTKPSPALVPASPRDVPVGVAESVLGVELPGSGSLRAHPPRARRRRQLRALLTTLALTAFALAPALVWSWLWWVPVAVVAVSGAVSAWIASDNSRGLGHAVTDRVVALRKGSIMRRTDVLTRDGILGWNIRRTPFQRRAGLVTLFATSAGGTGAFRLPDLGHDQAAQVWRTAGDVWDHLAL
ncbi:PH domain-containing protein [uncultured Dietzia sp.]|uniref:PH domain-containing protein n=1 Tax=uncultured Dietzia sp. TaxID=395519 RepID=UPI0025F4F991|nr:PH domain-containing protein [uncultured Dietzia sp.]